MAQLEWYKKKSKDSGKGYYDIYKNYRFTSDYEVSLFLKTLNNYWKDMVEEVDKQPQKEGAVFRIRWLYAGTNYRRMVEPLDIAQYYNDGHVDYINSGRSEHYKQLEKWQKEHEKPQEEDKKPKAMNKKNVQSILTWDSCFWAHVEEALISLGKCKDARSTATDKQEAANKLDEFEGYVYGLLKDYTVSPEIFLEGSSYMRWWKEYIIFKGPSHGSRLANFMKSYGRYENGEYDFSYE